MNTPPKSKILLIIIGILLMSNLILLFFYISNRPVAGKNPWGDRKAMTAAFLKNDIGFSAAQLQQYDSLSNLHRKQMKDVFEESKKNKETDFRQVTSNNFSGPAMDTAITKSAQRQAGIEKMMFLYFKDIRALCTATQLPAFDSLFYKAMNKRNDPRKK